MNRSTRTGLILFIAAMLAWIAPAGAQHATIETVANFTVDSGLYVIASDEFNGAVGYDRDTINTSADITLGMKATDPALSVTYRVSYQLLRADNSPVTLKIGAGTGTEQNSGSLTFNLVPGVPISQTINGSIRPHDTLVPGELYRVRISMQCFNSPNWVTRVASNTTARQFLHFPSTTSGDAAANTLALVDSVTFNKISALQSAADATGRSFEGRVAYTAHRYDNYNAASPTTGLVPFRVNYSLSINTLNTPIPLQASFIGPGINMTQYSTSGGVKVPYVRSVATNFKIEPSNQIQSVTKAFYITVALSHTEETGVIRSDDSGTSAPQQLLHMSGQISGSSPVTVTELETDPGLAFSADLTSVTFSNRIVSAELTNHPGYTISPFLTGSQATFDLFEDGHMEMSGGPILTVNQPTNPDYSNVNGIKMRRSNMKLNSSGATPQVTSFLAIIMPAGLGWYPGKAGDPPGRTLSYSLGSVFNAPLDDALEPVDATYVLAPGLGPNHDHYGLIEESKPFAITCTNFEWNTGQGNIKPGGIASGVDRIIYLRDLEVTALEDNVLFPDPDDRRLRSNELLYKHVKEANIGTVTYSADPANGSARSNGVVALGASQFFAHFPYESSIAWPSDGNLILDDDQPSVLSSLPPTNTIFIPYARDCESLAPLGCGTIGSAVHWLNPSGNMLITEDGGFWASGPNVAAGGSRRDVQISYLSELSTGGDVFTHDTSPFTSGQFFMAGHMYEVPDGDDVTLAPAILLNSGYMPSDGVNLPEMHRPGTQEYEDGLADYPGINYRVANQASVTATATLGGNTSSAFTLRDRSKYYLRFGGSSGIHEAEPGGFPTPVQISDYEFNISHFGLSFLDSEVHDSTTSGSVYFPYPSDVEYAFDSLRFDCLGLPSDTPPAPGASDETLAYWNADIVLLGLDFQTMIGGECDPATAKAVVAVRGWASNIEVPLHGLLGIYADGELITGGDGILEGIDSRLVLPNTVYIDGPREERYPFTALHHAWFNKSTEPRAAVLSVGTLNLAGLLDVPFFEDLEVHMQTGAREGNTTDNIYMMAGWNDEDGNNAFEDAQFDLDHRSSPVAISDYRELINPAHRTHARQRWLDIVPFDYPLEWNTVTRAFKASEPVSVDLMVVSAEHNLTYMSPDWAEIDFGADLNASINVPEINTANLASTVLEQTGVLQALAEESTEALGGILTDGIDQMAQLANDQLDALFDRVFMTLDAPIDQLADAILAANDDIMAIETLVNDELCSATGDISSFIHDLADQTGGASDLLDEIDDSLAKAQWAIRSVMSYIPEDGMIDLDTIVQLPDIEFSDDLGANAAQGLFAAGDGAGYDLVRALVACLIDELGGEAAAGLNALAGSALAAVEEELNGLLVEAEPTIDDIRTVLMDVHNTIGDIRTELAAGQGIAADMEQIFTDGATEIDAFLAESKAAIMEFLSQADIPELNAEELKARIRQEVRDRFNASPLIAEVQVLLKQYVADLEDAMNEAIESAFAEVNKMIVELLVNALPDLQEELNGMLGDVNSLAATGNIDGFARINGDALRSLRLDAAMQLSLPDPFEFAGYIEINQLDSNGDGTCSVELMDPDAYAAEVKMGALNIPVRFVGSDLRFDVGAKFSFDTDGGFNLRGFGGSLEMTEGEISIEAVTIFELGAAVAFGLDENYMAARVGLTFDQYTMAGGVFFGRACTLDPLLIADPDVGEVLGEPPFTGIYTYGEAQIPIVGASCLFSLQANAGAGVFVFAEGPTIGGKMKMGVTGKALCAVTVGGEVTLIGAKVGNEFNFFGRGRVFGEVGKDPFSIGFDESVEMTYKSNEWEYDF